MADDLESRVREAIAGTLDFDGNRIDSHFAHSELADAARAAIAEVLATVESNLAAVQYDPAPYTAMKHRLAAMKREAL